MGVDKMAIFAHVDEIKKEKKYIATTVLEGFFILILLTTNFVLYSKKKKKCNRNDTTPRKKFKVFTAVVLDFEYSNKQHVSCSNNYNL